MKQQTALLLSVGALAAAPPAALAQTPTTPSVPTTDQLQTTLQVSLERIGMHATVLVGDEIRVRGSVAAFVPDQKMTMRFYGDGKKLRAKTTTILPGENGSGVFELSYRAQRTGNLIVNVSHEATPELGALSAVGRKVEVLPRSIGSRASARMVAALQRRLARLGYVVGSRGSLDARTARAVLAFRKVTGMARTARASTSVMRAIAAGRGAFRIRRPDHGRHIEADLTRQVIALIEGGQVRRIYPTSSGTSRTPTVLGSFRFYRKTPGTNALGMVDSAYFIRGYATHGFASVPIYPASHGCLRVPNPDARSLYNWIRIGTPIDVYYGPRPK